MITNGLYKVIITHIQHQISIKCITNYIIILCKSIQLQFHAVQMSMIIKNFYSQFGILNQDNMNLKKSNHCFVLRNHCNYNVLLKI